MLFARGKVAVMIDGCFWHGCPVHGTQPKANAEWWREKLATNIARDRDTDTLLLRAGWLVLRFWEHENPGEAAKKIAKMVKMRRSSRI